MNELAITRSCTHETFGFREPFGRRLEGIGRIALVVVLLFGTAFALGVYIYEVNRSASKSYAVRLLEKQRDRLKNEIAELEVQTIERQTLPELQLRATSLGYVPIEQMDYLDVDRGLYALAK